ncbi:MAG: GNAT family N-acetyltransferase [Clostridia bacterium]|nr:GNAT family N-acetyltransferase [Clostridia bacterium]
MQLHDKTFAGLTAAELYAILRVRAEVFVVEQNCVYLDPDGTDLQSRHLYLEENGRILAYLRLFVREAEPLTVQIGRVLTTERGKGYGKQLMQEAIRCAAEKMGAAKLYLEAQCYAEGFYEKLGFQTISAPFPEDGIPHVQMIFTYPKQEIE